MVGKTVSHYRIIDKIGSGGMGVVFKAEDMALKRIVALKFLPPAFSGDREARQRFMHEARAASALDHPNICTIFEIGESEDQQSYIAMAYYEGESLKDKIEKGPLPADLVLRISHQLLLGLGRAHETGIVHRDIKPANIMITARNEVKILDFGLAKVSGQSFLTRSGSMLGTIANMSPEQIKGGNADIRSDIWACGSVMFEMLTGRKPFDGEYDHALMYSILNETPADLAKLPEGFGRIIEKCLQKDPDQRYQSVTDIIHDLRQTASPSSILPEQMPEDQRPARKFQLKRRQPGARYLIGLLIIVSILTGIYLIAGYDSEPDNPAGSRSVTKYQEMPAIITDLMGFQDSGQFLEKLNSYRRSMQIIVGNRSDFDSLTGCYVFILDEKNVEAGMIYSDNIYTDLKSGKHISDLNEKYRGKKAVWVGLAPQ